MIVLQLEQTVQTALRSDDELFHVALYDWMISKDMADRLLEVRNLATSSLFTDAHQYTAMGGKSRLLSGTTEIYASKL